MKTITKCTLILASILLTSCVNQNTKIAANIMPTTNPCSKLEQLKNAYYNDFKQIKEIKVAGRVSNIWKAKYQLFGENCQVFSWGGKQHTYSCRLVAPDEETAQNYYRSAKRITQECLGDEWQIEESNRRHDDGMKASFTNHGAKQSEQVTFSTHLVPTPGLFSTTWTLYYYVGNSTEPSKKKD
ncbi:hypothetical protein CMT41_12650 [Colwellia sp. MT41]|uniref:Lipoprotein n=1 Tax=Colwellia marinimaniae TaxID=1513592 RepID=A0ABQ0MSQ2_9GAMM|nr:MULTISPECIES: hypothetical protein [Colwellia]ALO35471.1 hypothetical protein CMT41_12650 [Colwellia sp. MT41]GAW95378.1 hypothetical protein MTCD1_00980 [Colwellia marinimaniae]